MQPLRKPLKRLVHPKDRILEEKNAIMEEPECTRAATPEPQTSNGSRYSKDNELKDATTSEYNSKKKVGFEEVKVLSPGVQEEETAKPHDGKPSRENETRKLLRELYNENQKDAWGQTPLIRASAKGNVDHMKLLMDKGALVDLQDNNGCTAMNVACNSYVISFLLEHNASINNQSCTGETPLFNVCGFDDCKACELLIQAHADIHIKCKMGNTALHKACLHGSILCVQLLIDRGILIDERNNSGSTAIHIAAEKDHFELVKLLINNGADITLLNSDGKTILELGNRITQNLNSFLSIRVGDIVGSPYGNGRIKAIGDDGMMSVEPINWVLANNKRPTFYLSMHSLRPYDPLDGKTYTSNRNKQSYHTGNDIGPAACTVT